MSKWIVWLGQDYITHDRPALQNTNELNTNRPKQTDKTQTKTPKTHTTQTNIYQAEHIIKINTF